MGRCDRGMVLKKRNTNIDQFVDFNCAVPKNRKKLKNQIVESGVLWGW